MPNWGEFNWGEEFWEGLPITATLKFYDRLGTLAKIVSTTAQDSPLLKLSFEFLRDGGCGAFKFETSEDIGIGRGYRFDLYLYQFLWYSGRVKIVPAEGTQTTFEYSGYGFFEQLDWKIVDEEYAEIELSALVEDILDKYYYGRSDILSGSEEIVSTGYSIEQLQFSDKFGKSTMQSLAEIASNYEYGVDEERHFYFRPYDTSIVERLWLGRGDVKSFKAEERDAKYNSYKVSCGRLTQGDTFIIEVTDVPDGEFARWGTIALSEVIPPFDANMAAGAAVTTSPVGAGAANITDGDTGTEWNSGEYQQIGDYIQIDLGSEQENIGKVVVDCTRIANNKTDYADGFRILISSTGAFAGEELEVFVGEEKFGSNEVEITFAAVPGRYVRIEINDAKPYFWRVDQIYIYPWKIGDITRWAGSLLLLNRIALKKGKLELSKIDRRILPRGKFRITSQDGSSYDDYPIISTKYQLNGKTDLQCSLELGETTISVADEILKMQREMAEQKLMGSSRSSNLSSGLYTSPGSNQQIGVDQVENQMIQEGAVTYERIDVSDLVNIANLLTVAAGRITIGANVLGAGLDGMLIVDDGAVRRVEIGEVAADTYGVNIRDSAGVLWTDEGTAQHVWQEVHDEILAGNATQVDVAGLDGNTDHIYYIICRIIGNAAAAEFHLRPNADGGNNYYRQWISANDAVRNSAEVNATTWMWMGAADTNEVCFFRAVLYARTGTIRTLLHDSLNNQTNVEPGPWYSVAQLWTNTVTNITSLRLICNQANGMQAGSHISVYKIPTF